MSISVPFRRTAVIAGFVRAAAGAHGHSDVVSARLKTRLRGRRWHQTGEQDRWRQFLAFRRRNGWKISFVKATSPLKPVRMVLHVKLQRHRCDRWPAVQRQVSRKSQSCSRPCQAVMPI